MGLRIGFGYDLHQLTENRPLILGGVNIPFKKGLKGHSDADVLLHAISDAILGAMALGDIGTYFPDTSPEYKNMDSRIIINEIVTKMTNNLYQIENVDSTIIAEAPKLITYISEMRKSVAGILHLEKSQVSVKATTNEKMGYLGENKAIAVHAVVLLSNANQHTA